MKELLMDCINELCLECGKYEYEFMGDCDGCKWYAIKTEGYKRNADLMADIVEDLIFNCEIEDCYHIEVDDDGTEHMYKDCPFCDDDGKCNIYDPSSWRI